MVGDYVYVSCGMDGPNSFLNTLERLDAHAILSGQPPPQSWEEVRVTDPNTFVPRRNPLMAPLNDSQILIIGGYCVRNYYKGQGLIFDTK